MPNDKHEYDTWPPWLRKYKDVIETTSIVVGIFVAVYSLISINSEVASIAEQTGAIANQTEAMIGQNTAIRDQTSAIAEQTNSIHESAAGQIAALIEQNQLLATQVEALWYSNRPVLRVHALSPAADIIPLRGVFVSQYDTLHDSSLYSLLMYTVENVSSSVAVIDSTYYEVSNDVSWSPDTTAYVDYIIPPRDQYVDIVNIPLHKDKGNLVKIVIVYRWDNPVYPDSRFELRKCFDIRHDGAAWRVATISFHEFENRKTQQVDAVSGP